MSTEHVQMDVVRDLQGIFVQQNAGHMNTEKTVRIDAVIIVTTTKRVILSLETVADARTVIKMQNVIKSAIMELMESNVHTYVGNVLMW